MVVVMVSGVNDLIYGCCYCLLCLLLVSASILLSCESWRGLVMPPFGHIVIYTRSCTAELGKRHLRLLRVFIIVIFQSY